MLTMVEFLEETTIMVAYISHHCLIIHQPPTSLVSHLTMSSQYSWENYFTSIKNNIYYNFPWDQQQTEPHSACHFCMHSRPRSLYCTIQRQCSHFIYLFYYYYFFFCGTCIAKIQCTRLKVSEFILPQQHVNHFLHLLHCSTWPQCQQRDSSARMRAFGKCVI